MKGNAHGPLTVLRTAPCGQEATKSKRRIRKGLMDEAQSVHVNHVNL